MLSALSLSSVHRDPPVLDKKEFVVLCDHVSGDSINDKGKLFFNMCRRSEAETHVSLDDVGACLDDFLGGILPHSTTASRSAVVKYLVAQLHSSATTGATDSTSASSSSPSERESSGSAVAVTVDEMCVCEWLRGILFAADVFNAIGKRVLPGDQKLSLVVEPSLLSDSMLTPETVLCVQSWLAPAFKRAWAPLFSSVRNGASFSAFK